MSPRSERDDVLAVVSSRIFSAMLEDIVFDAALQAHHEVTRSRCGMAHVPGPTTTISQAVAPPSRPTTPLGDPKATNGSLATGTSTPTSVKADGINYLECVNCSRPISSNRYAPHLSSCLGIGTGIRRGPARVTYTKPKNSSEGGRSASPSENGNLSDDTKSIKEKGKSKSKRADDADFHLKRKRTESPQLSPIKKSKKSKAGGSPVARVKTDADVSGLPPSNIHKSTPSGSHLKVPSKLRSSSTASFIDRERSSSPGSRSSSPETPVASISTPTSSAVSAQSPVLANGGKRKAPKTKAKAFSNLPMRHPSPPRPPPPPVRIAEPDYLIDVEADETGSSTDTDSP